MSKKETQDECTGRPCIVEFNHKGAWKPAQFKDKKLTQPYVNACNCRADGAIASLLMQILAQAFVNGELDKADLPAPDDFRITYVDEEALPPEVEVEGTEQASDIINSIRSKA